MTARCRILALLAGLAVGSGGARPAAAQAVGPEFRVNSYTAGSQGTPSIASAGDGRFVVVWTSSGQDGHSVGIFGQRFGSDGLPAGPEFLVNSYTTGFQRFPSVASAGDGRFVAVWESQGQDGSDRGIFGQRYAPDGLPAGPEFRVNSYTTTNQVRPAVASASDGRFVVVWASYVGQDGSFSGVFGQRYDSNGLPAGSEFRVNSYTTNEQIRMSVASAGDGRFVVVWESNGQDGSYRGVFGQRYDSNGAPDGPEFLVNSYTTYSQSGDHSGLSVASVADGRFVVVWESEAQNYPVVGNWGVFGQRYDSNGVPTGPEFLVNSYTTGAHYNASVSSAGDGRFAVVWMSREQDAGFRSVFGQRYDSNGLPAGPEFRVNSYTSISPSGSPSYPSVAFTGAGRFVVIWQQGDGMDGSSYGVFGRTFHVDVIFTDGFEAN